ncbi:MAG: hypothetical protein M1831_002168 [Alyxoria varia]|nr:MAG: hypothetical protein M1831_002168 [Alyxoria varia]
MYTKVCCVLGLAVGTVIASPSHMLNKRQLAVNETSGIQQGNTDTTLPNTKCRAPFFYVAESGKCINPADHNAFYYPNATSSNTTSGNNGPKVFVSETASQSEADASKVKPPGSSKFYNERIPLPNYPDFLPFKLPPKNGEGFNSKNVASPAEEIKDESWKRKCQNDPKLAPNSTVLLEPINYFHNLTDAGEAKEVLIESGSCLTKYPKTPEQEKDNVRVSICLQPEGKPNKTVQNVAVWAAVKDLADHCKGNGPNIGGVSVLLSVDGSLYNSYALVDRLDTPPAGQP